MGGSPNCCPIIESGALNVLKNYGLIPKQSVEKSDLTFECVKELWAVPGNFWQMVISQVLDFSKTVESTD